MFPVQLPGVGHMAWTANDTLVTANDNEFCSFNINKTSMPWEFDCTSQTPLAAPANNLTWTPAEDGMVAIGYTNGTLGFWKDRQLKEEQVFERDPVNVLQFNALKPNLLAVGGPEVFVINAEVAIKSSQAAKTSYTYRPGKNQAEHQGGEISAVNWNPQVPQVLAASSFNGITAVWDLRETKTLFNIHDPSYFNRARCTSLLWNSEIATQFVVAYDCDEPCIQIWDLRKKEYPVKEFKNVHTTGVMDLAWCPHDTDLMLSVDRGGSVVFWDFKQSDALLTQQHTFDSPAVSVSWMRKNYGVYSVTAEDGTMEISSLYQTTEPSVGSSRNPTPKTCNYGNHVAKWLVPKVGCAFGFGNTLVSFNEQGISLNDIAVNQTPETDNFCQMFKNDEYIEICKEKQTSEMDKEEQDQWKIIELLMSDDKNAKIIETCGLDKNAITKATEDYTGKKRVKKEKSEKERKVSAQDDFEFSSLSPENVEDFFNQAREAPKQELPSPEAATTQQYTFQNIKTETISRNTNWDEAGEKLIKQNLALNNLEQAIDCANQAGRHDVALIIAQKGGPELFHRTASQFLESSRDSFLSLTFKSLMHDDVMHLVEQSKIKRWEETLAFCITHGDIGTHVTALGDRLMETDEQAALKCYLISENFNAVFQIWKNQFNELAGRLSLDDRFHYLKRFVEKVLVFKMAIIDRYVRPEVGELVSEYAEMLIAHGNLEDAHEILAISGTFGPIAERLFKKRGIVYKGNPLWDYVDVRPVKTQGAPQSNKPAIRKPSGRPEQAPPRTQPMVPMPGGMPASQPFGTAPVASSPYGSGPPAASPYGSGPPPAASPYGSGPPASSPFGNAPSQPVNQPYEASRQAPPAKPATSAPPMPSAPFAKRADVGPPPANAPPSRPTPTAPATTSSPFGETPVQAPPAPVQRPTQAMPRHPPPMAPTTMAKAPVAAPVVTQPAEVAPVQPKATGPPPMMPRSVPTAAPPTAPSRPTPQPANVQETAPTMPRPAQSTVAPPQSSVAPPQAPPQRSVAPPQAPPQTSVAPSQGPPQSAPDQSAAAFFSQTPAQAPTQQLVQPVEETKHKASPPPETRAAPQETKVAPPPIRPAATMPSAYTARAPAAQPVQARGAVQAVDMSSIPGPYQTIANVWKSALDSSTNQNPRVLKDTENKLNDLFSKMSSQQLSETTVNTLQELTNAFQAGDSSGAMKLHNQLTQQSWNENKLWLTAVKWIIKFKST